MTLPGGSLHVSDGCVSRNRTVTMKAFKEFTEKGVYPVVNPAIDFLIPLSILISKTTFFQIS